MRKSLRICVLPQMPLTWTKRTSGTHFDCFCGLAEYPYDLISIAFDERSRPSHHGSSKKENNSISQNRISIASDSQTCKAQGVGGEFAREREIGQWYQPKHLDVSRGPNTPSSPVGYIVNVMLSTPPCPSSFLSLPVVEVLLVRTHFLS